MNTEDHLELETVDRTELFLKKGRQLHTKAVGEVIRRFLALFSARRNGANVNNYVGCSEEQSPQLSGDR